MMTRTEAIATINAKLASLDDARVTTLAEIAQSMSDRPQPVRKLSDRELSLIERSKADFAQGRSYSLEESNAYVTEQLARRGGSAPTN